MTTLFYWTGAIWWGALAILVATLVVWRLLDWVKPVRPVRPVTPARPHLRLLPSTGSHRSARSGSAA